MTTTHAPEIVLRSDGEIREALRSKDLRQALYDSGSIVMADCLLDLHGSAHRDRRRLENRLFRREVFEEYETTIIPARIDDAISAAASSGGGDLVRIGYRTVMHLTALVAGVDVPDGADDVLERLVRTFAHAATSVHAIDDREERERSVRAAIEEFDDVFLAPSVARRTHEGPRHDVLSVLLQNVDALDLPREVIRREVAFYLQAGGHSTANALTHTLAEIWASDDPDLAARAAADIDLVQACVHEALRLHPASPVAWRRALEDVTLRSGQHLPSGTRVVLDLESANRDPCVWGDDAAMFRPRRPHPDGVQPWGLSFGGGMHACIGMELDGGMAPSDAGDDRVRLRGTVALLAAALLQAGARPDPADLPSLDPTSTRSHYATYPVVFAPSRPADGAPAR